MDDFKILLQAVLDTKSIGKSDRNKMQKAIEKYHLKFTADLDKAAVIAEVKKMIPQIEAELKNITGIDIKIHDKDLMKAFKQVEKEADQAAKAEEKLIDAIERNRAKTEQARQAEEKRQQAAQARQQNKVLEKEYALRQKILSKASEIELSIDNGYFSTQIDKAEADFQKYGLSAKDAENKTKELRNTLAAMTASSGEKLISDYEKWKHQLAGIKVQLDQTKLSHDKLTQPASQERISSVLVRVQNLLAVNTRATKEIRQEWERYVSRLSSGSNIAEKEIQDIALRLQETESQMRGMGKLGLSWTDSIKKGLGSFTQWVNATSIIMAVINTFRKMIQEVKVLDSAQVELSKVSDLTSGGLADVTKESYRLGKAVAKTGSQVLDAVTEFKRAGYDIEQSMGMAEAALIMTNVADGITQTSDAAETLLSVLKGFHMPESDVMSVVDKIKSVSNQSPVSFNSLAEGLERVSGTLSQSGNSIDETLGLLTGGFAHLRDMEKVSSGLVTISTRLRGVGEDGEVIDGLRTKLQEDFAKIGVAIEDQNGKLRSTTEIMKDYAKVLPTLTSEQKQYYGELSAGKDQITVWDSIIDGMKNVDNAIAQSIDSVGSAAKGNEKYLDSIEGKMADFSSSFQQLSQTVIDSDFLKSLIEGGTGFINVLDTIIEKGVLLPTIFGGIGITAFIKNLDCRKVLKIAWIFELV